MKQWNKEKKEIKGNQRKEKMKREASENDNEESVFWRRKEEKQK